MPMPPPSHPLLSKLSPPSVTATQVQGLAVCSTIAAAGAVKLALVLTPPGSR